MQIRLATLGMAPADYVTNCSECLEPLKKARGDAMFHIKRGDGPVWTICRDCAGHHCLEAHLAQGRAAALDQTAANIRETRSH